jgi:hypothetical protein
MILTSFPHKVITAFRSPAQNEGDIAALQHADQVITLHIIRTDAYAAALT